MPIFAAIIMIGNILTGRCHSTDADLVSAVTNADIVTATTDMHCDWVEALQR
jgi:hypothetical protein